MLSTNLRSQSWVSSWHHDYDHFLSLLRSVPSGHTLLFCSVNNSVAAIAHLLKATTALYMIVHPNYLPRAEEAIEQITQEGGNPPRIILQAQRQVWRSTEPVEPFPRALTPEQEGPLPVFIVHSSGSTGFPKVSSVTFFLNSTIC